MIPSLFGANSAILKTASPLEIIFCSSWWYLFAKSNSKLWWWSTFYYRKGGSWKLINPITFWWHYHKTNCSSQRSNNSKIRSSIIHGTVFNLKRYWCPKNKIIDWSNNSEEFLNQFLFEGSQVKNIWIPYGE